MISEEQKKRLFNAAKEVRENAYAPYSRFPVGTALLSKDDRIFTGCNVENSSYPATVCSERSAINTAIGEGVRDFKCALVYTGVSPAEGPCGFCLQAFSEFCSKDFRILIAEPDETIREVTLGDLFPASLNIEKMVTRSAANTHSS